jgi:RNA recognition motif-containing protein
MKLHIGNLPKVMTEPELNTLVVEFGKPETLELVKDTTGGSKGYGFAEFANETDAKAVIAGLDGKDFGGQTLKVAEARPRKTASPVHSNA